MMIYDDLPNIQQQDGGPKTLPSSKFQAFDCSQVQVSRFSFLVSLRIGVSRVGRERDVE